ncbi:MAG: hypothetical protein M1825_003796 [Sarcosagium campestre]|nr:MAG: hypothetical protein M1825_003796 [Sarcosagium campestre]
MAPFNRLTAFVLLLPTVLATGYQITAPGAAQPTAAAIGTGAPGTAGTGQAYPVPTEAPKYGNETIIAPPPAADAVSPAEEAPVEAPVAAAAAEVPAGCPALPPVVEVPEPQTITITATATTTVVVETQAATPSPSANVESPVKATPEEAAAPIASPEEENVEGAQAASPIELSSAPENSPGPAPDVVAPAQEAPAPYANGTAGSPPVKPYPTAASVGAALPPPAINTPAPYVSANDTVVAPVAAGTGVAYVPSAPAGAAAATGAVYVSQVAAQAAVATGAAYVSQEAVVGAAAASSTPAVYAASAPVAAVAAEASVYAPEAGAAQPTGYSAAGSPYAAPAAYPARSYRRRSFRHAHI